MIWGTLYTLVVFGLGFYIRCKFSWGQAGKHVFKMIQDGELNWRGRDDSNQ